MSTAAQKSANIANSCLSTGPKTEQGKQNASRNSAKHYLTAKQIVVPGEDPEAYDQLQAELVESWNPANPQEHLLVDQIAQNAWRLLRVRRLEAATFEYMMPSLEQIAPVYPSGSVKRPPASHDEAMAQAFHANAKAFENIRRYATSIERAYHNAIAQLRMLQKERKKSEIGSVSQSAEQFSAGSALSTQPISSTNPVSPENSQSPKAAEPFSANSALSNQPVSFTDALLSVPATAPWSNWSKDYLDLATK